MPFSKIFQILFIFDSTFSIWHSGVHQQFMVVFLVVILRFWRTKKTFPPYLSALSKIRDSSLMPSPNNYFRLWEFFSPIRSISWVVSISLLRRPSFKILFIPAFSYCSPNLTGASFKFYLISSWSLHSLVSKFPQVSLFVLKFLPVIHPFTSFVVQFLQWFFQDSLLLLSYEFIRC